MPGNGSRRAGSCKGSDNKRHCQLPFAALTVPVVVPVEPGRTGAGAGTAAGNDVQSRSVSRRQLDHSAHGQEPEVVFTLQPVELYNSILAGEVVDALCLAEFKDIVAGLEGVLDHLRIFVVCVSAYGQPREQGHDHEHCQQSTDDPFLHICSP